MRDPRNMTAGEILADLILNGGQICGKRIEIVWPEGLPPAMTKADIAKLARSW